ncbi:MBL fold metallo-hydrolase [Pseudarthrobacter sp. lyk4-40-TYG-27]|uniref:MBL fold metallo-hydrolase n=1 Tax=Pseudarthrobacter sp. lyk4-40-TYG-27 TaxID=3040305 RepID=UPI0025546EFB|nr:MBL fold metallo-hydrolase [Pseudarthrobacter sp. lyk4-40-TYG-27]
MYDIDSYSVEPALPTKFLQDGDILNTLQFPLEIMATPGHSLGSICLYDPTRKWLLTGDTVYERALLDAIRGASRSDYRATMERLLQLEVQAVFRGHGPEMSPDSLRSIAEQYLERT